MAEGNGLFHLVQEQSTPQVHKEPALPAAPHRGGDPGQRQRHRDRGGLLEQGPERRPLPAGGHVQLARKHGHVHRRPGHRPGGGRRRHRRPRFLLCFANSDGAAISSDTSRCIKTSGCCKTAASWHSEQKQQCALQKSACKAAHVPLNACKRELYNMCVMCSTHVMR